MCKGATTTEILDALELLCGHKPEKPPSARPHRLRLPEKVDATRVPSPPVIHVAAQSEEGSEAKFEWAAKYRAAIFETNSGLLPQKISDAEYAVIARARELFQGTGDDVDAEREELDEVLYTLHAFRKVVSNKAA